MIRLLLQRIRSVPPVGIKAVGMAVVGVILLGSSLAFGVFDSSYDLNGPYDQIYPVATPRPTP